MSDNVLAVGDAVFMTMTLTTIQLLTPMNCIGKTLRT